MPTPRLFLGQVIKHRAGRRVVVTRRVVRGTAAAIDAVLQATGTGMGINMCGLSVLDVVALATAMLFKCSRCYGTWPFTKKGDHGAGVARQHNGRLGKEDNRPGGQLDHDVGGAIPQLVRCQHLAHPVAQERQRGGCEGEGLPRPPRSPSGARPGTPGSRPPRRGRERFSADTSRKT